MQITNNEAGYNGFAQHAMTQYNWVLGKAEEEIFNLRLKNEESAKQRAEGRLLLPDSDDLKILSKRVWRWSRWQEILLNLKDHYIKPLESQK